MTLKMRNKGLSQWHVASVRFLSMAILGCAMVVSAAIGVNAQEANGALPFPIFQKEPYFRSSVNLETFNAALEVAQSYQELAASAAFEYDLDVSLDGQSRVFNSISSVPFGPDGRLYRTTTVLGARISDPEKALLGTEEFSFGCCGENSGVGVGLGFNTQLLDGKAVSQANVDSGAKQFTGSYLGEGLGAVGIGFSVGSGSPAGNQSYNGSISIEGDYRISYRVNSGPSLSGRHLSAW